MMIAAKNEENVFTIYRYDKAKGRQVCLMYSYVPNK
jgi:hypothetical protein